MNDTTKLRIKIAIAAVIASIAVGAAGFRMMWQAEVEAGRKRRLAEEQTQHWRGVVGNKIRPRVVRGNRKSGLYHLPNCVNYNDIAERNLITFETENEAAAAGFRRAGNCR